jgi:signal transduction histidine kinase
VLNSSQSLPETLNYIAKRASQVMDSQACLIHKIDYQRDFVEIEASYGLPDDLLQVRGFPLHSSTKADDQILNHKPVWVPDFQKLPPLTETDLANLHPDVRTWRKHTNQYYRAWFAVPLVIGKQVYGSLAFYFDAPRDVNPEEIQLASTFADQAALAIENARLYQAAEDTAIAAERNRLARDLHDAVTQTLFSASMIADVLPRIWERKPDEGQRRLEELRQLTRGALSEMRTLLVELRPAALVDTDLGDLIGHQVNAFIARTRIPVEFECHCEHNPPPEIKEAFYRIAQEAFNNIAKHAEATMVKVQLDSQARRTELLIQDDGQGFDLELAQMEGLGLGIMAERAANVGAQLEIFSRVKEGMRLILIWQENEDKESRHE